MTDPFINVIVTTLSNYSIANSLGWTVVAQNSPNRKEYNNTPFVIVTPSPKAEIDYICFGKTKTVNSYDCYLLSTADLASNFTNVANVFFDAILSNFMPQNSSMYTAGIYEPSQT